METILCWKQFQSGAEDSTTALVKVRDHGWPAGLDPTRLRTSHGDPQ